MYARMSESHILNQVNIGQLETIPMSLASEGNISF